MARGRKPGARVKVQSLTHRPEKPKPYGVRWVVNGREFSAWFQHKASADSHRSALIRAIEDREVFSPHTGLPVGWAASSVTLATYVQRWFSEMSPEWKPRSRRSAAESLARLLLFTVQGKSAGLSTTEKESRAREIQRWISAGGDAPDCLRRSPKMSEITRSLCDEAELLVSSRFETDSDGARIPLAQNTRVRHSRNIRAVFANAVDDGLLVEQPWGQSRQARKRARKPSVRVKNSRLLPSPQTVQRLLALVPNERPGSRRIHAVLAAVYFAGLRPSEAIGLRVDKVSIPEDQNSTGWMVIAQAVNDAGSRFTDPTERIGSPKTAVRAVPITPPLAAILRPFIAGRTSGLVFEDADGQLPDVSNIGRSWRRAQQKAGLADGWRVYDLRHACANLWVNAGMSLGLAASWLGHTPETLAANYIGISENDQEKALDIINEQLPTEEEEGP